MPWRHREPRHQQLWYWLCCPRTRLVKLKHLCMEPVSIYFFKFLILSYWICLRNIKICLHSLSFSPLILRWESLPPILQGPFMNFGCWGPGYARGQSIKSNSLDPIIQESFCFSTRRVKNRVHNLQSFTIPWYFFYHHIVGENRGGGGGGGGQGVRAGWGWGRVGMGVGQMCGGAGASKKIWILGGGTRKKIRKKGGGGWEEKIGRGQGVQTPLSSSTILLKENQEFLQWITTTANPLSRRDSWVVNRIVTEVNHCSAEYSIVLYVYWTTEFWELSF